ncbi:MAG: hypothetical protein LBI48_06415 [Burkholderiaceae bacterium]|nr:hypothetical protein [Burkholderiaceae bacterium]
MGVAVAHYDGLLRCRQGRALAGREAPAGEHACARGRVGRQIDIDDGVARARIDRGGDLAHRVGRQDRY